MTNDLKKQFQDNPEEVRFNLEKLINDPQIPNHFKYVFQEPSGVEVEKYKEDFTWEEGYVAKLSYRCKDREELVRIMAEGFSDETVDPSEFGIEYNDYYVIVGDLSLKEGN